jgi:hypothetical protein
MNNTEFNVGVIKPFECMKEGWDLISDRYWMFFLITLIGFIVASVVPFCILLGPMMCGIYMPLKEKFNGNPIEFGQVFKGFEKFMPSLMATLPWAVPLQIAFIVGYIPIIIGQVMLDTKRGNSESALTFLLFGFGVFALVLLVWIFVHPFLMFVYQIVLENDISGVTALRLSFKSVWGNLGGVVGLLVLNVFAYSVGILFCGIGAYFVLPLIFANTYVAYRKVFPMKNITTFDTPPMPNAYNL